MLSEFREDLGPLTLRVLYGFVLTGVIAAAVRALWPWIKGEDIAVGEGLWVLGGIAVAGMLFGFGAWVQARRAPARMYRYSRDLSIFVTALFQTGKGDREAQIKDILHEARTVYERETGVPVAPAVVEPRDGQLEVVYSSSGDLAEGTRLPPDGSLADAVHRELVIREDNLKRRAGKPDFPRDLEELHRAGFHSVRAAPLKAGAEVVAVLVVPAKGKRKFNAADDRFMLVVRGLLNAVWRRDQASLGE